MILKNDCKKTVITKSIHNPMPNGMGKFRNRHLLRKIFHTYMFHWALHKSLNQNVMIIQSLKKKRKTWSSLVAQWVKYPALLHNRLGHCCIAGSIPGLGTSTCHGWGQKRKEKRRKEKKENCLLRGKTSSVKLRHSLKTNRY